jgi:hypothetical protein
MGSHVAGSGIAHITDNHALFDEVTRFESGSDPGEMGVSGDHPASVADAVIQYHPPAVKQSQDLRRSAVKIVGDLQ